MDYKPADLFIGVIDFFGILAPGSVFLFLQGKQLLDAFDPNLNFDPGKTWMWAMFLLGAYVLGHFLLGAGVPFNRLVKKFPPKDLDVFYKSVKDKITLPSEVSSDMTAAFYRAYAFVRLKSPSALTEIERQMADYKLFRSLMLVFALDIVLSLFCGSKSWPKMGLSAVLCVMAAWRFLFLIGWTYRITFEYYALLTASNSQADKLE